MSKEIKLTTALKLTLLVLSAFYINSTLQIVVCQFLLMVGVSATVVDGLEIAGESLYIAIESFIDTGIATIVGLSGLFSHVQALELIFAILFLTTIKLASHWYELVPFRLAGRRS